MFWALPKEVREWQKSTKYYLKYNVLSYIVFETNFNPDGYEGLKKFELYFTYSSTLEDLKASGLTEKKLRNVMKQLEEEGYIEWVYKSNTKHKPSVLKNLVSEKIALEQEQTTTKPKKKKSDKLKAPKEVNPDIEEIWSKYPNKKGKTDAVKGIEKALKEHSKEEMIRAVERYKEEKKGVDIKYIKNGSTFFNTGYIDYLDENYQQNINEKDKSIERRKHKISFGLNNSEFDYQNRPKNYVPIDPTM